MSALAAFQPIIVPSGPQFGVPYTLTGPDGQRAVFNDPNDADYVGMLTDTSGFDSPDIRENADDLVEMDGGLHGDFFFGRRPITLEGQIMHDGDTVQRNMQIAKLQRASMALRGDATLVWTPDGGVQQFVSLRRQQPLRITGSWNKTFQLTMVASDPRIYSTELHAETASAGIPSGAVAGVGFDVTFPMNFGAAIPSGQMYLVNQGNGESFPTYYIYGPGTSPAVINMTTGSVISLLYTMGLTDVFIVDTRTHTVQLAQRSGADDLVNYVPTPGFTAASGVGLWSASGANGTVTLNTDVTAPSGLGNTGRYSPTDGTQPLVGLITTGTGAINGVVAGQQYTVQYAVKRNQATARDTVPRLTWRTSGGTVLSQNTGAALATVNGSWVTYTASFLAPVSAQRADLELLLVNGGVNFSAETFDFDMISMVQGASAQFGYGDQSGWMWDSTSWNSKSRLPGIEINLDTANDRYGVLDFANTQWGGIVAGSNDVRLSFFSFSTGAKLIAEYRDAWI